eukprot:4955299-Pyramimonas_sp.AAC.1
MSAGRDAVGGKQFQTWVCSDSHCRYANFMWRTHCRECEKIGPPRAQNIQRRPGDSPPWADRLQGDWARGPPRSAKGGGDQPGGSNRSK